MFKELEERVDKGYKELEERIEEIAEEVFGGKEMPDRYQGKRQIRMSCRQQAKTAHHPPQCKKTRTVFALLDEKQPLAQEALSILKDANIPFAIIPVAGGFPIVAYGPRNYTGSERIRMFVDAYKNGRI